MRECLGATRDVNANGEQHEILRLSIDGILKFFRPDYATRMKSQGVQQRNQNNTSAFTGTLY